MQFEVQQRNKRFPLLFFFFFFNSHIGGTVVFFFLRSSATVDMLTTNTWLVSCSSGVRVDRPPYASDFRSSRASLYRSSVNFAASVIFVVKCESKPATFYLQLGCHFSNIYRFISYLYKYIFLCIIQRYLVSRVI